MSILDAAPLPPPELASVREVRIEIAAERLARCVAFYGKTLQMPHWPKEAEVPGAVGFGNPARGLLLVLAHDPDVVRTRRRLTLTTVSLEAIEARLADDNVSFTRIRGFGWTDQLVHVHDPNGHLIEIRQSKLL